jgi:hypothetical protein
LLPQHFEISLDGFRSHPEAGWVCGSFRCFGNEPPWPCGHNCDPMPDHFGRLLRSSFIGPPHTVMYRRQVLVKSGGFDKHLKSVQDTELYLRLIRQAPLYCHHQLIAEYRQTDTQMSRRWHIMLKEHVHIWRAQWRFVRGHRLYEEAYFAGIACARAIFGERALWQMVTDVRSGQWTLAIKAFWALLTCYPVGLVNLLVGKARKILLIEKQSS